MKEPTVREKKEIRIKGFRTLYRENFRLDSKKTVVYNHVQFLTSEDRILECAIIEGYKTNGRGILGFLKRKTEEVPPEEREPVRLELFEELKSGSYSHIDLENIIFYGF